MIAWIQKGRAGKSLFAISMLLALLLRTLIPTGYMPTIHSQQLVVELCSDMGGKTVTIELGHKGPIEKHHAADGPCVFAAGLGQGLLTSAELTANLPVIYRLTLLIGTAIADLTVSRLPAPPPPSQGPPALS